LYQRKNTQQRNIPSKGNLVHAPTPDVVPFLHLPEVSLFKILDVGFAMYSTLIVDTRQRNSIAVCFVGISSAKLRDVVASLNPIFAE
jgi:hypothetical protein